MTKYEYRIPIFGPNYSNSRIVPIVCNNTDPDVREVLQLSPGAPRALELLDPLLQLPGGILLFMNNHLFILIQTCFLHFTRD